MHSTQWGFVRDAALMLLESAILAPSSHNTQPWLFRVGDGVIQLLADRTRALPVNDPDDRELTISCACALLNLRVAATHAGFTSTVRLFPLAEEADLLASIELESVSAPAGADENLFNAIAQRATYRFRFDTREVPESALSALRLAARAEGGTLRVISADHERMFVGALIQEGDRILWSNPSWRRELAAWMHPRRRGDGIAIEGLPRPLAQLVIRTFDMGGGIAAKDKEIVEESPVLALLGTAGDSAADWMAAGQALQRILLMAQVHGIQASFLNQPIQVPSLRLDLVHHFAEVGIPQILIRLGYRTIAWPRSPRRELDSMIDHVVAVRTVASIDQNQGVASAGK